MWTLLLILGFLITDSGLTDPCVDHTILDQVWRSVNCIWPVCSWQWKCDANLQEGWYRFKSSGGWKIPDSVVPELHCSTYSPGWLQGSHPTLGQGVVTRTVCFTSLWNPCNWTREIKVKNCSRYFVYELKPAPGCSAAYCTDPGTAPTPKSEEDSTRESTAQPSSTPAALEITDQATKPSPESDEHSARKSTLSESTSPKEETNYKMIRVKVTSVRGLNEERARDIIMDRFQKDQCLIGLKREDIQCTERKIPYFTQDPFSYIALPTIKHAYHEFEIRITFRPDAADVADFVLDDEC
ncbi:uromodulin-like [Carcharodon carcharias]|uniref:uromodulin-like n=1 Tax=Carcharodon carcharias TaxID=13397 RepID=UPI001B7E33DC|nr:uromodulin-like [Carcharodon carcharias]